MSDSNLFPDGIMTLRDYFAAKAMQAAYMRFGGPATPSNHDGSLDHAAQMVYQMADAMLKARNGASA